MATAFPPPCTPRGGGAAVPSDGAPLYQPPQTYTTGAETVVFTFDSNMDGVVDAADNGDDAEETDSNNPNDLMLYRRVYGWDGAQNTVQSSAVALLRGPIVDAGADAVVPMLSYRIDEDDDDATPAVLHGDTNGDGSLDGTEIGNVAPLSGEQLARIESIDITVTGETTRPDPGYPHNEGYKRMELEGEVLVRHRSRSIAVIHGTVYKDLDGSATRDAGEPAIANVRVRSSSGAQARSDIQGGYRLTVYPGEQTIVETDPTGYVSTTPNQVSLNIYPGQYARIDFGDRTASGTAAVVGAVYVDANSSKTRDQDERGIANVKIYAESGEETYTNAQGDYHLDLPVGTHTVSETDSTGYVSTTPNAVDVSLDTEGGEVTVNFGDSRVEAFGTVAGYVYLDDNRNGQRDNREPGIPGAVIHAAADSTESDNAGYFSLTVPVGMQPVTETDPPGYTSTTPNTLQGVVVEADKTVTVLFGDVLQEELDFDVIELSDTERALSLVSGDLAEDTKGDPDLVLGTRFSGGANNLLVWHNARKNSRTPNSAIFNTTPSYSRSVSADVRAVRLGQFDGNAGLDVVTGLEMVAGPDLNFWANTAGALPNSPTALYNTNGGATVTDIVVADFNRDSRLDLLLGGELNATAGQFEVWRGNGAGQFARGALDVYSASADAQLGAQLKAAVAVASADLDHDGVLDVVIATVEDLDTSALHMYRGVAAGGVYSFVPVTALSLPGRVTDLVAADLFEDDQADVDVIASTSIWDTNGLVVVWHQDTHGNFGLHVNGDWTPSDMLEVGAIPQTLEVARLDGDVFPDVLVGTRDGAQYTGNVLLARGFGFLPSEALPLTSTDMGAVVTVTLNDFNMDFAGDFAAGTQTSASTGRVVVFYQK